MKKLIIILLILFAFYKYIFYIPSSTHTSEITSISTPANPIGTEISTKNENTKKSNHTQSAIDKAFNNRRSHIQVEGSGRVIAVLRDDTQGSRHQKFLLRLSSGKTILIAHNIDLSPRIQGLSKGDNVKFYGEYSWNNKGGVVHWTHKDPRGRHKGGWLQHQGRLYQ